MQWSTASGASWQGQKSGGGSTRREGWDSSSISPSWPCHPCHPQRLCHQSYFHSRPHCSNSHHSLSPPSTEATVDAKNYASVNSKTFENRPPLATGNQPDPIKAHGASVQCAKATGERFLLSDDRLGSIEPTEAEVLDSINFIDVSLVLKIARQKLVKL
jgi:hypothetical protein